ncbi:hypothetical protein JIR23_00030 [Bradyrhizobium diazoefficiens]|nr:hypothetical protein [Bradyrhizobium diazoefficiens]QQN64254.1 hypothetical protein JIR23_00030 [Bradyrhizobium diazoefficiens]
MDQQQKSSDSAIETIAKTVPGEFVSFVVLLKTFLANNPTGLVVLGLLLTLLLPVYANRVLAIASWSQIGVMMVSYLAWFVLLVPDQVDQVLMNLFQVTLSYENNFVIFGAVVLVLQFALPFLTKPKPSGGGAAPVHPAQ